MTPQQFRVLLAAVFLSQTLTPLINLLLAVVALSIFGVCYLRNRFHVNKAQHGQET